MLIQVVLLSCHTLNGILSYLIVLLCVGHVLSLVRLSPEFGVHFLHIRLLHFLRLIVDRFRLLICGCELLFVISSSILFILNTVV